MTTSINKNQPEHNRKDLTAHEAVDEIRGIVNKAETCFFCTTVVKGGSNGARPMTVQKVDESGDIWFLSASDSSLNEELAVDPSVQLYFQGSKHSDFLHLSGHASISRDQLKINEFWDPIMKVWFTEGINDPRITVIRVTPSEGYYWDTKHGGLVAGVKMMIGAMIGKTLDDSIEGKIKL